MAFFSDCFVASSECEITSEKFGRCAAVLQRQKSSGGGVMSLKALRAAGMGEVVAFQGVQFAESFQWLQLVLKEDIS